MSFILCSQFNFLLPQLLDIIKQLSVPTLSRKIILRMNTLTSVNDREIVHAHTHTRVELQIQHR